MQKINKNLIVLGIATLLTMSSSFFMGVSTLLGGISDSVVARGFPFHFIETQISGSTNFLLFNFLFDLIFYTIVASSVYYLIMRGKRDNKWWLFLITIALSIVWLMVDITRSSECVSGFPIAFRNVCQGESNITGKFIAIGTTFDLLFWFCLSSLFIASLSILNSEKIGRWRYFVAPIFISLMSFWYNTPCGGGFCIFVGRGFPLPFYVENNFSFIILGADFLLWTLVLYPLCRLFFMYIKNNIRR